MGNTTGTLRASSLMWVEWKKDVEGLREERVDVKIS